MWRGAVGNIYLQVNALAFIMVGIIYLIMLGRAVATLAAVLGHDSLAVESRLFNIGNIGILLLPCLLAVVYLGVLAIRHDTNLLIEFSVLLSRINLIAAVIFLLPLSLTLSLVWAAKDIALGRLAQVDTERQQEGGS